MHLWGKIVPGVVIGVGSVTHGNVKVVGFVTVQFLRPLHNGVLVKTEGTNPVKTIGIISPVVGGPELPFASEKLIAEVK